MPDLHFLPLKQTTLLPGDYHQVLETGVVMLIHLHKVTHAPQILPTWHSSSPCLVRNHTLKTSVRGNADRGHVLVCARDFTKTSTRERSIRR